MTSESDTCDSGTERRVQEIMERRKRATERSTIGQMKVYGFIEGDDSVTNRIYRLLSMRGYSPSPICVFLGHKWTDSDSYDYHETEECERDGCEGGKLIRYVDPGT